MRWSRWSSRRNKCIRETLIICILIYVSIVVEIVFHLSIFLYLCSYHDLNHSSRHKFLHLVIFLLLILSVRRASSNMVYIYHMLNLEVPRVLPRSILLAIIFKFLLFNLMFGLRIVNYCT